MSVDARDTPPRPRATGPNRAVSRVVFVPRDRKNPYQALLAGELGAEGMRVDYTGSHPLSLAASSAAWRSDVVHLHWLDQLYLRRTRAGSVLAALVVAWRSCRREAPWSTDTAVHAAGLTTLGLLIAFVLGNKVFAPQYLMWIAPLALGIAVARQPVAWSVPVLLLLAAASTQVFYPRGFAALQHVHPVPVAALNIRNALVAAIWAITLARPVSILRAPTAAGR